MINEQNSPAVAGPVERRVMRKPPDKWFAIALMSAAAKSGSAGAIRLAAQLAGAEPCERCGFVWNHCKCEHNACKSAGRLEL